MTIATFNFNMSSTCCQKGNIYIGILCSHNESAKLVWHISTGNAYQDVATLTSLHTVHYHKDRIILQPGLQ